MMAMPVQAALRVCADPNNLPFSNAQGRGFENMLAQMLSEDLGTALEYEWTSQARGSLDVALDAGLCNVILGARWQAGIPGMTQPYYRSNWVFVTRVDRNLDLHSFSDLDHSSLRVGLRQDRKSTPPSAAMSLVPLLEKDSDVRLFPRYGVAPMPSGIRSLIDAVTFGDIDVAVAWGPAASYFVARSRVPLRMQPVVGTGKSPALVNDVAIRVRSDDPKLLDKVTGFLRRRAADIRQLLSDYRVPVLQPQPQDGLI